MADTTTGTKQIHITIVTPERAVLDEHADLVVLPMHDGELGVLPGRAAFVGQLGPGELRIKTGTTTKKLFIDGGFVQCRTNTLNVLTATAKNREDVTEAFVTAETAKVAALPASNAAEVATKKRGEAKVKALARLSR